MTVYTLNGKTVVAFLQKSWNILDCGWNFDPDLKLFFVHNDGTTTELECTNSKEQLKYYNGSLSGPHFCGLPIDFRSPRSEVHFWQRELITGGPKIYNASIDSVVVLQMSICLESISPSILTRVARMFAHLLRIWIFIIFKCGIILSSKIPIPISHKFPSKPHHVKQSYPDSSTKETKPCIHHCPIIPQICIGHNYNSKNIQEYKKNRYII